MAKRRRRQQSSDHRHGGGGSGGGDDLISDLGDDVLVHVLSFLPAMTDVVRACAVSRRWRHLWARVPSLRFDLPSDKDSLKLQEQVDRFVAFVNHVLAGRFGHADATSIVEQLAISIEMHDIRPAGLPAIDAKHVDAWIRYAMQQGVKSLSLKFDQPDISNGQLDDDDMFALQELPSSARLETMALSLGYLTLQLPAAMAVAFNSLVDVSLEDVRLDACSSHLLGPLLSSACCPCLQKLRLVNVTGLAELQLDTPRLRVFNLEDCSTIVVLTMLAPRLEELTSTVDWQNMGQLDIGDLPCVRSVRELDLNSCGYPFHGNDINGGPIHPLLQRCTAIERLGVFLVSTYTYEEFKEDEEEEVVVDDMMKDVPQLPHVKSLTVRASPFNEDALITGLACLLTRSPSVAYLQLKMTIHPVEDSGNQANHPSISLPQLREIEIRGFKGLKCEDSLMGWLHASAPALNKITLSFRWSFTQKRHRKKRTNLLPPNPFAEVGWWAAASDHRDCGTFVWTPLHEEER